MTGISGRDTFEPDRIEQIENAVVQHGCYNGRIYLMKWTDYKTPPEPLLDQLDELACKKGYGKIIAKIHECYWPAFQDREYQCEAIIPHYYHGNETCRFAARFFKPERTRKSDADRIRAVMDNCRRPLSANNSSKKFNDIPNDNFGKSDRSVAALCRPEDAEEISRLFQRVFTRYPFPIQDPSYIKSTMNSGFHYFGIKQDGRFIALASLEADSVNQNGEMGDFATLPEFRGRGLARQLLNGLDTLAHKMGLKTVYSIARARSFGMNRVFAGAGYLHGGLLVNNTRIGEGIESMNVWNKRI